MSNPELNINEYQFSNNQANFSEIPTDINMEDWKNVSIKESSHPLILLNGLHKKIKTKPMYYINGIKGSSKDMYLRSSATERLIQATNLLPENYSFVVFDAHRPVVVQAEIFNAQKETLKNRHPNLDDRFITAMTEIYVSIPSTDHDKPSPHSTGGAIDLSICDNSGNYLDMGTEWDSFDIKSRSSYFNKSNTEFENNRKLLYKVMSEVGFTNYPEEWWHFDFGNQFWGHIIKQEAIYGYIEGGDTYDNRK